MKDAILAVTENKTERVVLVHHLEAYVCIMDLVTPLPIIVIIVSF